MYRASAALFLSLLVACAPAITPEKTFVDSYYGSTVNGQMSIFNGRAWIYDTADYTLHYWLGTHPAGIGPGSVKLELTAKTPVVIDWNDSLYIYADSSTSPIIHEGVPYGYRAADTNLEAQAVTRDRVVPTGNLVYSGNRVTRALTLVGPDAFGTSTVGLNLVINGQTLTIRFDGTRKITRREGR